MASGTSIKIDPVKVAAAAKAIDNQRTIINNGFTGILRQADLLNTEWEGESAEAYKKKMRDIRPSMDEAVNILTEYVLDLNKTAETFADAETKLKVQNEALPTDVFGV